MTVKFFISTRTLVILVFALVVAIQFLGLRACWQEVRPDYGKNIRGGPGDNSVVKLADGSVMVAKPGSISRDVIDWFNDAHAPARRFDVGRLPFVSNSAIPAMDTQVRLERFARELNANPAVNVRVLVCASAGDASSAGLSALRAQSLKAALVAKRVDADRISTEECRAGDSGGVSGSASDQDGQVISIILSRQG